MKDSPVPVRCAVPGIHWTFSTVARGHRCADIADAAKQKARIQKGLSDFSRRCRACCHHRLLCQSGRRSAQTRTQKSTLQ
eukprot:1426330-Rhodomonas_salina.1